MPHQSKSGEEGFSSSYPNILHTSRKSWRAVGLVGRGRREVGGEGCEEYLGVEKCRRGKGEGEWRISHVKWRKVGEED